MKNWILGTFTFMVPLVFISTFFLPDIVNVVTVPMGLMFAAIVLVADCMRKKFFTKYQLFKMFLNSVLLVKFFVLYEIKIGAYVAMSAAIILVFVGFVILANKYDVMVNETLKADNPSKES